jgi:hypothetical protein
MNQWLFGNVEQNFAIDMYGRMAKSGMSGPQAAQKVREALGRFDNLTAGERYAHLNSLFYFYPWMKTVIPFWVKKGLMDPRWAMAPVSGTRTINELQGYDDPSQPFTLTTNQVRPGVYGRLTEMIPQRVLQPLAAAAQIPLDLANRDYEGLNTDFKAIPNYIMGHLNPFAQVVSDAAMTAAAGGPTKTVPWNTFHLDPNLTLGQNLGASASQLAQRFVSPFSRVVEGAQDPAAALATIPLGGFVNLTLTQDEAKAEKTIKSQATRTFGPAEKAALQAHDFGSFEKWQKMRQAWVQYQFDARAAALSGQPPPPVPEILIQQQPKEALPIGTPPSPGPQATKNPWDGP